QIDGPEQWTSRAYRTGVASGAACDPFGTDAINNCYDLSTVSVTGCSGPTDLTVDYEYEYDFSYNADATDAGAYVADDWTVFVQVEDDSTEVGSLSETFEMNTLNALQPGGVVIDYGTVALGANSSEQTMTITNTGNNDSLNIENYVDADMTCLPGGTIPAANAAITATSGSGYVGFPLVGASHETLELDLGKAVPSVPGSDVKDTYYRLTMPATGVNGACTNTLSLVASN
ncbi:hypothetical protein KKC60_01810, partial [Patescibacteria group bacterium]|nr:hypothetical protein [Patescibacteria group bacterium]